MVFKVCCSIKEKKKNKMNVLKIISAMDVFSFESKKDILLLFPNWFMTFNLGCVFNGNAMVKNIMIHKIDRDLN